MIFAQKVTSFYVALKYCDTMKTLAFCGTFENTSILIASYAFVTLKNFDLLNNVVNKIILFANLFY